MLEKFKGLVRDEEGQAMTEYGLILALVAVVVIGVLVTFGGEIKNVFVDLVTKLRDQTPEEI